MQAASVALCGVRIDGTSADGHVSLPLHARLSVLNLLGLALRESGQRANPRVRSRIVVGIAIAVDIAHVRRRRAVRGAQPPVDPLNET